MRRRIAGVVLTAALAVGVTAYPVTSAGQPGWLDADSWERDLAYLDQQVRAVHPDPFSKTPESVRGCAHRLAQGTATHPR